MSPRRRQGRVRRSSGPVCPSCHRPIVWFRSPFAPGWRCFEPRPVHPTGLMTRQAFPVEHRRAWRFTALVEELMGRYECGHDEAQDHAYAMPWHVLHDCDTATPSPDVDLEESAR